MYLLDANCLIALGGADHEHHERMRKWFKAAKYDTHRIQLAA